MNNTRSYAYGLVCILIGLLVGFAICYSTPIKTISTKQQITSFEEELQEEKEREAKKDQTIRDKNQKFVSAMREHAEFTIKGTAKVNRDGKMTDEKIYETPLALRGGQQYDLLPVFEGEEKVEEVDLQITTSNGEIFLKEEGQEKMTKNTHISKPGVYYVCVTGSSALEATVSIGQESSYGSDVVVIGP